MSQERKIIKKRKPTIDNEAFEYAMLYKNIKLPIYMEEELDEVYKISYNINELRNLNTNTLKNTEIGGYVKIIDKNMNFYPEINDRQSSYDIKVGMPFYKFNHNARWIRDNSILFHTHPSGDKYGCFPSLQDLEASLVFTDKIFILVTNCTIYLYRSKWLIDRSGFEKQFTKNNLENQSTFSKLYNKYLEELTRALNSGITDYSFQNDSNFLKYNEDFFSLVDFFVYNYNDDYNNLVNHISDMIKRNPKIYSSMS